MSGTGHCGHCGHRSATEARDNRQTAPPACRDPYGTIPPECIRISGSTFFRHEWRVCNTSVENSTIRSARKAISSAKSVWKHVQGRAGYSSGAPGELRPVPPQEPDPRCQPSGLRSRLIAVGPMKAAIMSQQRDI